MAPKPPRKGPPRSPAKPPAAKPNPELQAQTKRLLGKHYASKYQTGGRRGR